MFVMVSAIICNYLVTQHHLKLTIQYINAVFVCTLPDISCELFPLLHIHLRVARLRWTVLMLFWDVKGYGELRFTCRAGSRIHTA